MHKSQRIITLLRLLEGGKSRSIVKLAKELDRTERTIWRDIAELKALNFPVEVQKGSCRFGKQTRRTGKVGIQN